MKKFLFYIFLFIPLFAFSQGRVEESSHKDKPEWIDIKSKDYIIISEQSTDLETVKNKTVARLQSIIMDSIAQNILEDSTIKSNLYFNEKSKTSINYKNYITSKICNEQFITSISNLKFPDYYWEKFYNRKSKSYYYEYHIKYILQTNDINTTKDEFKVNEKKITETLRLYENRLNNIPSVEFIDNSLKYLDTFKREFQQEDKRYSIVNQLITNYKELYKKIDIDILKNSIGTLNICLLINNKVISYSKNPEISSNCANQFNSKQINKVLYIDFDFFNCNVDENNWIELKYTFGTEIVSKKINIKVQ